MKKFFIYLFAFIFICFILPALLTKKEEGVFSNIKEDLKNAEQVQKEDEKIEYDYKDYNKTILLEKNLDSIEFTDEKNVDGKNITPDWDLYNTYKYTFKIVDNKYYFERLELNDK